MSSVRSEILIRAVVYRRWEDGAGMSGVSDAPDEATGVRAAGGAGSLQIPSETYDESSRK